jgi:hypothetical protein
MPQYFVPLYSRVPCPANELGSSSSDDRPESEHVERYG